MEKNCAEGGMRMTPYRVVVCEDDAQLGEDLARRCREIFAGWRVEAEVRLFASADALQPALS